ncbi:MAG TPA: hypothetical protein VH134_15120 [Candidatus Dormibacteraeota bacterium]|jgi:hypothetical protein|nr:hypothetical protein [Candidatus Dormibacteraeota bacterium]
MSGDLPASSLPIGTRVSFPYGGSRRTGVVSDVSLMPNPSGDGSTLAYLVDVGARKVFVQGDGIAPAGDGPLVNDAEGGPPQRRRGGGGSRPRRRR